MSNIALKSENIVEIGSFHLTNAVLASLMTTLILAVVIFIVRRRFSLIPGRMQSALEITVTTFEDFLIGAHGSRERARKFLAFFVTLFLFLIVANQFSVIPLVNSLVVGEGTLLFRGSTADYSQTIALGLIAILGSHILALMIHPVRHIGNFIKIGPLFKARSFGDLGNALLEIFLGILDIIGELAKFISVSSRLFGNIVAGEIIIVVISGIASFTAYIIPIPFLILSIFSSFVQAFVFTLLALNFMAGTVNALRDQEAEPELETVKA